MNTRSICPLAGLLLFVSCGSLSLPAGESSAPRRPNVVYIISDDQAWHDYGFLGSETIRTPRLDQLAEEGLVHGRGYVPTALCRPSLATLATGLHTHAHGITGNDPPRGTDRREMLSLMEETRTLPELLAGVGYRSLQTGKWWEGDPTSYGFTEAMTHGDPERGGRHGDEGLVIGREGLEPITSFIDSCVEEGSPFLVWYAPFLPHAPHNPPPHLLELYESDDVPISIARYQAMCTWFDETCGELLDALDERGLTEDTLVVLVTDNGWLQQPDGRWFLPRSKGTINEAGVRTPIVLRQPGTIEPGLRDVPVSSVDLVPTILAACGLEVPGELPGVDLLATREEEGHGPVFGASYTHDVVRIGDPRESLTARYVVRDPYKLLVFEGPEARTELYDLREDPAEERPLDRPELEAELRALLDGWYPGRDG